METIVATGSNMHDQPLLMARSSSRGTFNIEDLHHNAHNIKIKAANIEDLAEYLKIVQHLLSDKKMT